MYDAGGKKENSIKDSKFNLKSISWVQAGAFQCQLWKNSAVKNGPSATRQTIQMKD
jgi:hypothetical protein